MAISPSVRPWLIARGLFRRTEAGRRGRTDRIARPVTVDRLEDRTLLASNWTALANQAPTEIQTMELLTNGDVMAASYTNAWYLLTPSSTGSYVDGTWSKLANEPTERLYDGSNILQNGNYFVIGGEYIGGSSTESDSNTGDIYDPFTNSWSTIAPFPKAHYGDDPTMLLENDDILTGYLSGPQTYLYDIASNSWSQTGTKNNSDRSDEENWVKLSDDSILSYDIFYQTGDATGLAQRYIPSTGTWVNTGPVPIALSNTSQSELGPNAVLPNGDVIQIGGDSNTAIFDPSTDTNTGGGTWTAGPVIPGGNVSDDAPGVLLPDGQFIFTADQPNYTNPTHVFDYDYTTNTITDITPSAANGDPSDLATQLSDFGAYTDRFLMLPNGQALFTVGVDDHLYVYTGTGPVDSSSTPSISGIAANASNSYTLTGSALNGASEGATYGDDAEMDSNYPIVSVATEIGTVYYATTTDWNMTGVGVTNGATSVNFALPTAIGSPPSVTANALDATDGEALDNVAVATFTDPNGKFTGDYAATINWGDGMQTTGTVTGPNGSGVYSVTGTHTYFGSGSETLTVTIVDNYASGQLSVSGDGVSSTPTSFNLSAGDNATFNVKSTGLTTTTSVGSALNPSTYGESVTFTVAVDNTSGSGGVPSGSVEFFDGATDLGPGTALGGSGTTATSTFTIATLPAGTQSIRAVYSATGVYGDSSGPLSQVVNQAELTVSRITAANKQYDASPVATVNASSALLSGVLNNDVVTLVTGGATGTFASQDVGTGITVVVAGLTLSGAQATDYTLTEPTTTANITPASLSVLGVLADDKVYNHNTVATLETSAASLSIVYSGDTVILNGSGATGTFASQDVGSLITVTITGLTISGAQSGDYTLTQPTTTASITPAELTVSGLTVADKVYDASPMATLVTSGAKLVGSYNGDNVGLDATGATGIFASQDVGSGITVTVTGLAVSGAQGGDYMLTQPTTTANITAAPLTVTGITAAGRVYDASTDADIDTLVATLNGVYNNDSVSLSTVGATGAFASDSVGTGLTVIVAGLTISGGQAGDYVLTETTTTANITAAPLTVTGVTAANKAYNATRAAIVTESSAKLVGVYIGDTVSLDTLSASGTFTTDNVGTGITVTVAGLLIDGPEAGNYSLTAPSTTANITPAGLTVSGLTAVDKVYNANAAATLNTSSATLVGAFSGDTVTLKTTGATGTFASAAVGTGIVVTAAGLKLSGAQAGDYMLAQPTTTANITPAKPSVNVSASGGTYNSSDFIASADVTGVVGAPGSKLEGVAPIPEYYLGITATGTPFTAAPVAAGTYTVVANFPGSTDYATNTSQPVTFTISQAAPTVSVSASGGGYNDSGYGATASVAGLVGSPGSELEGIEPTPEYYAGSSATGTPFTTAPIDAGAYTVVADFPGSTDYAADMSQPVSFSITQATPTVSVSASGGTYTGSAINASATVTGVSGEAASQLNGIAPAPAYYAGNTATGAPLSAAPSDVGTYTVVAAFPGSTDYVAGISAPVTFTIIKSTPTLSLSTPVGSFDGSPLAVSVTITGNDNSSGASLGGVTPTLTYYAGSATSGTSLGATPPTDAGTYMVVASFPGNADYAAVQSAPVAFTIGQGTATIALTSSLGSAVYGQAIAFAAKVAAPGTPSGTVTFVDNGTALGTVALNGSGTATLTTSALAFGSHTITATYNGDANLLGVQSKSASAAVSQSGTNVVLVPLPVLKKKKLKSEVLTAEIEPISPGGGFPTGTVTFELVTKKKKKTKTKVLGTTTATEGAAKLTVKPKLVLKQVITVIYSGDNDFIASTLTAPKLTKKGVLG